jgi:hypothetical protein
MVTMRSLLRALGFVIAFALTYVLLIRFAAGQRFDAESFGAVQGLHDVVGSAAKAYRVVVPILLALAAVVCGVIALVQRRVADTVRAALIVVLSFGIGEGLKLVLPRPDLGGYGYADNTFPSGHVAFAFSAALAAAIIAPPRARRVVTVVVMLASVGVAWASVVSYAHRPSDVLGGALVVGLVGTVLLWGRRTVLAGRPVLTTALLLLTAASIVLVFAASPAPESAAAAIGWLAIGAAATGLVAGLIPARPASP